MKALLIDDQATILAAFQSVLLAFDSHVALVSVESARAARQAMAAGQAFDFVLLDLQLAGDNGLDLSSRSCAIRTRRRRSSPSPARSRMPTSFVPSISVPSPSCRDMLAH